MIAPHSSVGTTIDLREYFPALRGAGQFRVLWRPYAGGVVSDPVVITVAPLKQAEVVGTITLIYDHGSHDLPHVLSDVQHQFHENVLCATHVHLDDANCLEVVVLRGPADAVRAVADRLTATRGVKHGKLVCTTTGAALA